MGQKLTPSNKKLITPEVEVFLLKYFPSFQFQKLLNNGLLIKTALVTSEEGEILIARIYFRQQETSEERTFYEKQIKKLESFIQEIDHKRVFNIAPILFCENHLKAGMIMRQYYAHNLKERIYLMPYLTNIEKKWLSFQLLFALKELNRLNMRHGDIKMENIVMTSFSSLFLCDFFSFKPAYISMDDMTSYTFYFGSNSDNIKSCYLAPERLLDKKEIEAMDESMLYEVKEEMDIFSAGAVIAELFLEESLFDYTKILNYKKGNFDLEQSLSQITDVHLKNILIRMLDVDPNSRIKLDECLDTFATSICPIAIPKLIVHMNNLFTTTVYYKPDLQIGLIYKHWTQIWKILFGLIDPIPILNQPIKFSIANKVILKNAFNKMLVSDDKKSIIALGFFESLINPDDLTMLSNEEGLSDELFNRNNNHDSLYIILHYIFLTLPNLVYESNVIVALEMIKAFSKKLDDITKIQLVSPYIVSVIKGNRDVFTKSYALQTLIDLLTSVDYQELLLPSSDYNYFDSYIFPSILEMMENTDIEKETILILAFENILDVLIDLEDKFLNVMLKSKVKNLLAHSSINTNGTNELITSSIDLTNQMHNQLKERKEDEVFKSYDIQIKDFKHKLFRQIQNYVFRSEIEIVQALIRKFPKLLQFYGKRETENFGKLLIDFFNKKEWIIKREMLRSIPEMMNTLRDSGLYDFIMMCFEGLVVTKANELQVYELIKAFNQLIKQDNLDSKDALRMFTMIKGFAFHPNMWIRNETIDFISNLVSKLSPEEIFCHLYRSWRLFFEIPVLSPTKEMFIEFSFPNIARIYYETLLQDIILPKKRNDDIKAKRKGMSSRDKKGEEDIPEALRDVLSYEKKKIESDFQEKEKKEKTKEMVPLNKICFVTQIVVDKIKKIVKKEHNNKDTKNLDETIFKHLIEFMKSVRDLQLPKIINRDSYNFDENENFLAEQYFDFKYLFKALNIFLPLDFLGVLEKKLKARIECNRNDTIISDASTKSNLYYTWKPQGQLLSTLYSHNTSIERIMPGEGNQFVSIDSNGGFTIWRLAEKTSDEDINFKSIWTSSKANIYPIKFNKTICSIEKKNYVFASENNLYKYNLESIPDSRDIPPNKLFSSEEGNNIICAMPSNNFSQIPNIVFINQNNRLNIYDQRMENVAAYCNLPFDNGMVSCMQLSKKGDSITLGTLGGFVYSYDFRLNSVTLSFKYYNNTPIIGIDNFFPAKGREYDLYSLNQNPSYTNYLTIWSGTEDHEIGLWNMDTLHCDVLFKVNSIKGTSSSPLLVNFPSLNVIKETEFEPIENSNGSAKRFSERKRDDFEKCFESVIDYYPHIYKSNLVRGLLLDNSISMKQDFSKISSDRLNKLINLYEGVSTVQKVLLPRFPNQEENLHILISAGNDMIIRCWDFSKDFSGHDSKSFIINGPNDLSNCNYSRSLFGNTVVIQSNEIYSNTPKKDIPGFSKYQNFNCTTMHSTTQKEFDPSMETLKNCTKISASSHKSIITDLLPLTVDGINLLISSSWDGTVKVWK